jgi:hypothetical protein
MKHKLSSAVFAQGWLEGQIDNMVAKTSEKQNEDPTSHLIVTQIHEQWTIVSQALDDLIKENAEMKRKLAVVESAFQ